MNDWRLVIAIIMAFGTISLAIAAWISARAAKDSCSNYEGYCD